MAKPEAGSGSSHTKPTATRVFAQPDTTEVPTEDDKPTRKTVLFTVLVMTVLTISTLLLYNVRSR